MKGKISISGLIQESKSLKELNLIYNIIKKHSYFEGSKRKMYKKIINKKREVRKK